MSIDIDNVDLLGIAGRDTELKRVARTGGGEYAGACPFCGGTDRFRVQLNHKGKGARWFCRGCGDGRWKDAAAYIQRREGCDFREALRVLGIERDKGSFTRGKRAQPRRSAKVKELTAPDAQWQKRAESFVTECEGVLWSEEGARALAYLHRRGLRDETIRRYRLGFHAARDEYAARGITIPHIDKESVLWGVKIRTDGRGKAKYLSVKGGKACLFGLAQCAGQPFLVFCEGEFDAMILAQEAGELVDVVSLAGAAKMLPAAHPHSWELLRYRQVFVVYDNDAAGEQGGCKVAPSEAGKVLKLPADHHDVNDAYIAGFDLDEWIGNALPNSGFGALSNARLEAVLSELVVEKAKYEDAGSVPPEFLGKYELALAEWDRRAAECSCRM